MKFFSIISQADISNRVTHWFGKGEREGNAPRRTFLRVAAAALAAGILLASPQVKAVLCSAGEWLGNLAGGHSERFSDGFEIVDYGYDYVALRKTVSPLHQTLAVGDFEFTFQDLLCHDYLSGEYTYESNTLAVPVRVTFKGDKETYGAYMPPYEMKFNLAGGWYYDGESEQYFSAYDAVLAIQPDQFVVTSVTLLTDKISGYTVSKKDDPEQPSTGYGIYNERYYVIWKNTQDVEYHILNKDYQDDLSDADPLNEADQVQSWEAVPFYDSADSSGRKKHF